MKIGLEVGKTMVKEDMPMSSKNKGEWADSQMAKGEPRIIQTVVAAPRTRGTLIQRCGYSGSIE